MDLTEAPAARSTSPVTAQKLTHINLIVESHAKIVCAYSHSAPHTLLLHYFCHDITRLNWKMLLKAFNGIFSANGFYRGRSNVLECVLKRVSLDCRLVIVQQCFHFVAFCITFPSS